MVSNFKTMRGGILLLLAGLITPGLRAQATGAELDAALAAMDATQTTPTQALMAELRATPLADYAAIEARMLTLLQNPATTPAGKKAACRGLFQAGGERSVPVLQALRDDPEVGAMAQYALEGITDANPTGKIHPLEHASAALILTLKDTSQTTQARIAAMQVVAQRDPGAVLPSLLTALKGDDLALAAGAARATYAIDDPELTPVLATWLPQLPAASRVMLITALGERGMISAEPALLEQLKTPESDVRDAALEALAKCGDVGALDELLALAAAEPEQAAAIYGVIARLHGDAVDQQLLQRALAAEPAARGPLLTLLEQRMATSTIPTLIQLSADADDTKAKQGWHALGEIAPAESIEGLVERFVASDRPAVQPAAAQALVSAGKRGPNAEALMTALLAAYAHADTALRTRLLEVMGKSGGERVFGPITEAVASSDATLKDAGIRALTNWPGDEAAPELFKLASESELPKYRILALQGYLQLAASTTTGRAAADSMTMLRNAQPLVQRDEEKRLLLGALGSVTDPDALRMALPYLDDPAVNAEAGAAVAYAAVHVRGMVPAEARAGLEAVVAKCTNEAMQQYARDRLAEMPAA